MAEISRLVQVGFNPQQAKHIAAQIGWCDIDELWAYASATTITVPTGAASRFQVGDKLRLTQTTVKYFYVVAVADTVLTVTGGSDYTVANAAISSIAYSRCERPFGFPGFFTHGAIINNGLALTFTGETLYYSEFKLSGTQCTYILDVTGTLGGSALNYCTVSIPIAPARGGDLLNGPAWVHEGGAWKAGFAVNRDANYISIYKSDVSNFATTGTGYLRAVCTWEVV